jgi:putative lipoic acid-binding regulatory protein
MEQERLDNLRKLLDKEYKWPAHFNFKFIYKSDSNILEQLEAIFPIASERVIKHSKKKNYESLTVNHLANNADEVLDLYKKASAIEGVITL